jgi:hypothetical protein
MTEEEKVEEEEEEEETETEKVNKVGIVRESLFSMRKQNFFLFPACVRSSF